MSLLTSYLGQKKQTQQAALQKSILHYVARLGGQLFGPVPQGNRREFFCLDERTWVWHEEWTDKKTGKRHIVTTRYDVRPDGILKSQGSNSYQRLSETETQNFVQAVHQYRDVVRGHLQKIIAA
jgi:hypothetical protein